MNIYEKMVAAYLNHEAMPLKGKTKITLQDVHTGRKRVIESENMVTNAVANILNSNFCGYANFASLTPLKRLFGGVLLFADHITETGDNYNPPADDVNAMTACAGNEAHATANPYRGNPNGGETILTDTSIKQVWDWSTNQGVGPIKCVCLCPSKLGNMGLKPFDDSISPWTELAIRNNNGLNNVTALDRNFAMKLPVKINNDGQTGICIWWSGTTFEEITVRHDWLKLGIMRGTTDWQEVSNRTATVRAMTADKAHFCQDDDYYYCFEVTGATTVMIDKIDKTDMSVTEINLTVAGVSLYAGTKYRDFWNRAVPQFAYDGTYIYLYNSDRTGIVKVNPNNAADVVELTGTLSTLPNGSDGYKNGGAASPIVLSPGLVVGDGFLANGTHAYNIGAMPTIGGSDPSVGSYPQRQKYDIVRKGAACYAISDQWTTGSYLSGQGPALLEGFLSSINNLDSDIDKSGSETMKVEYTLTEV